VVRGVNYAGVRFLKEAGTITEEEALALEEGKQPEVSREVREASSRFSR
jgi:hypothetical protein